MDHRACHTAIAPRTSDSCFVLFPAQVIGGGYPLSGICQVPEQTPITPPNIEQGKGGRQREWGHPPDLWMSDTEGAPPGYGLANPGLSSLPTQVPSVYPFSPLPHLQVEERVLRQSQSEGKPKLD